MQLKCHFVEHLFMVLTLMAWLHRVSGAEAETSGSDPDEHGAKPKRRRRNTSVNADGT